MQALLGVGECVQYLDLRDIEEGRYVDGGEYVVEFSGGEGGEYVGELLPFSTQRTLEWGCGWWCGVWCGGGGGVVCGWWKPVVEMVNTWENMVNTRTHHMHTPHTHTLLIACLNPNVSPYHRCNDLIMSVTSSAAPIASGEAGEMKGGEDDVCVVCGYMHIMCMMWMHLYNVYVGDTCISRMYDVHTCM